MAKIKNRFLVLIIVAAVFVIYNILALAIPDLSLMGKTFWTAYAFTVIAFGALAGMIGSVKLTKTATTNTIVPLYLVAGGYFALALITNIIIMAGWPTEDAIVAAIIINIILLLIAVIAFVLVFMSYRHIKDRTEHIQKKVGNIRSLAIGVGSLEYRVSDPAVKKAIRELKDAISFSDPMGNENTVEAEEAFEGQIEVLKSLVASGVSSEDLLAAIADARGLLQTRNETILASR